jgi:uncharacterized paraquat-inducible protein A
MNTSALRVIFSKISKMLRVKQKSALNAASAPSIDSLSPLFAFTDQAFTVQIIKRSKERKARREDLLLNFCFSFFFTDNSLMQCLKCEAMSSIDCQVYLPGETRCLRCGAEMTEEQKKEWQEYWQRITGKRKSGIARLFSR